MKRVLGSGWFRAFLVWTALIVVLIVPYWPAATAIPPPCASYGAVNQDPSLPPCPPDAANYEGIYVVLLFLLWFGGTATLLLAFGLSRGVRWLRARHPTSLS